MSEKSAGEPVESFREVESWLRFSRLSRAQARRLRALFWDARIKPRDENAQEFNATVRLREGVDYGWLKGFVREGGFGEEDYGVAVSVATDDPTPIVRVPKFVADLGKEIGGFVDLSFCVGS